MPIILEHTSDGQELLKRPQQDTQSITKAFDSETSYTCVMNSDWNGDLVVYTQTSPQSPLPYALRQDLLARGYALAIVRYPEKPQMDQVRDYHIRQIQGFFARRCGTPRHVYEIEDGLGIHLTA